jgi:hypothetical protein
VTTGLLNWYHFIPDIHDGIPMMSHALNAPHLPKKKPGHLGYAVLILAALSLLLVALLSMADPGEETGKPIVMEGFTQQLAEGRAKPEFANRETAAFMVRVDQEAGRLNAFDPLHYSRDPGVIAEGLAAINQWAMLIQEAAALDLTPDQRRRVLEFRHEVIAGQKRFFPILRSHYGPAVQQKVAKHNVAVLISDADHTTIEFVGGMFGSIGYQQGFTEMMWPILRRLRFKKIQYREYRSQDTFALWNILTPEDEVLVVWERDAGGYRIVE